MNVDSVDPIPDENVLSGLPAALFCIRNLSRSIDAYLDVIIQIYRPATGQRHTAAGEREKVIRERERGSKTFMNFTEPCFVTPARVGLPLGVTCAGRKSRSIQVT